MEPIFLHYKSFNGQRYQYLRSNQLRVCNFFPLTCVVFAEKKSLNVKTHMRGVKEIFLSDKLRVLFAPGRYYII